MKQIVINLPDDIYERIAGGMAPTADLHDAHMLIQLIRETKPLPPHDDLIDISELEPDSEWSGTYDEYMAYSIAQVMACDVVIPSNREETTDDI